MKPQPKPTPPPIPVSPPAPTVGELARKAGGVLLDIAKRCLESSAPTPPPLPPAMPFPMGLPYPPGLPVPGSAPPGFDPNSLPDLSGGMLPPGFDPGWFTGMWFGNSGW